MPQPDTSNDKQVTVDFDTSTQTFTFTPSGPVVFEKAGRLIIQKKPGSSQNWTLSNVVFDNYTGTQFPIESKSGQQIIVDDDYTTMGTFSYEVEVTANNTTYTSPDPKIVNESPTM